MPKNVWRSCKARIWKWTSPVRWIAWAVKLLNGWVTRNTVIYFACFEAFISIMIAVIFYLFHDIDDVGFIFHDWKWFCLFTLGRACCAPVGIFAACLRKVNTMKVYFSCIMINIVLAWLLFAPFLNLECACTDYRQCTALGTFTSRKIDNSFPEPNKVKYQSSRSVPYAEPPRKMESEGDEYSTSYEDQLDMEDAGSSARSLRCVEEPGHPTCGGRRLTETEESGKPSAELNVMDYYTITYPDIWWESESPPTCVHHTPLEDPICNMAFTISKELAALPLGDSQLFKDFTALPHITQSEHTGAALDVGIARLLTEQIWSCATKEKCSIVQAVVACDEEKQKTDFSVCSLNHQSVPVLAEGKIPSPGKKDWKEGKTFGDWNEVSDQLKAKFEQFKSLQEETLNFSQLLYLRDFSMFFQKDPLTANAGYLLTQRLFNRQGMSQEEGTKLMLDVFSQGCVCDRKDDCQAYYNTRGEPRYWCWVNNKATRRYCEAQNVKLYKDPDQLKYWTDEICEKAGCKCAYIGVAPSKDVLVRTDLLEDNHLNYGSRCGKWDNKDEAEWCNVGFDSCCADRSTVEAAIPPLEDDTARSFRYYRSYLPCEQALKTKDVNKAHTTCRMVQILSLFMLFALNAVSVPITVVIFTFVKNRCGDNFEDETQFDVQFSSDSESDNDWEIEETPKANPTENQRQVNPRESIESYNIPDDVPAESPK